MTKKILFEDALIHSVLVAGRFLVRHLPLPVSLALGRGIGRLGYAFSKRRGIAYKNLRAVFAGRYSRREMKRIARRSFENLGMNAIELLKVLDMDRAYIEGHVEIEGRTKFLPHLEEGKGIIFLTAHFGNWELLSITGSLLDYPVIGLARTQKHPRSDAYLNAIRMSKGNQIVSKGMPVRELLRCLRRGGIIGILSDQDGGKRGTFVDFFGRQSSVPGGVAAFSARTRAPIYPIFMFRGRGQKHRIVVKDPLCLPEGEASPEEAERALLQQFHRVLESVIREAPDHWLWAHRRWKSTPDRSVLVLSDGKPGHINQSLAVLEMIKKEQALKTPPGKVRHQVVEPEFRSAFAKRLLIFFTALFGGRLPWKPFWLRQVLTPRSFREVAAVYADIVLSCGSSLAALNLLVKEENQAKSLVIMKPPSSHQAFEAVLVPKHDRIKEAKNIFKTDTALTVLTAEDYRAEGKALAARLALADGQTVIGLLLGGNTAQFELEPRRLEETLLAVKKYCAESKAALLLTTSRRTPGWAETLVKELFKEDPRSRMLVIAGESNPPGTVAGILGLSRFVLVSGESVSMVSEAVRSQARTIVFFPGPEEALKGKVRTFIDSLAGQGLAKKTSCSQIYRTLKDAAALPATSPGSWKEREAEIIRQAVQRVVHRL